MTNEKHEQQKNQSKLVRSHTQLDVYKFGYKAAMDIFELSKAFPIEERYSLTDQVRRSSRSVCANLAEAWRKRRYEAAFISKLTDAEAEAAETQTWLSFGADCDYMDREIGRTLYREYEKIIRMIVTMENNASDWTF